MWWLTAFWSVRSISNYGAFLGRPRSDMGSISLVGALAFFLFEFGKDGTMGDLPVYDKVTRGG